MTKREWLDHLIVQFSPPAHPLVTPRMERVARAKQARQNKFGERHAAAGRTCQDILNALILISHRNIEHDRSDVVIEGMTQKEISRWTRWSESTVCKYLNILEEMGLIRIEHKQRIREGKHKGRFTPNRYILTFLEE